MARAFSTCLRCGHSDRGPISISGLCNSCAHGDRHVAPEPPSPRYGRTADGKFARTPDPDPRLVIDSYAPTEPTPAPIPEAPRAQIVSAEHPWHREWRGAGGRVSKHSRRTR